MNRLAAVLLLFLALEGPAPGFGQGDAHAPGASTNATAGATVESSPLPDSTPQFPFPWLDLSLPVDQRVEALLSRLTPEQKVAQLQTTALNAIPELGVPAFNWYVECMHGASLGDTPEEGSTIYPQNLVWAATFDDALVHQAASEIGDELRAHYNKLVREGQNASHASCFAPHVAIVRDPRWGRLCETYGEDPYLAANMAATYVDGLQGGHGTYLKVGATCKHFLGNDLEGRNGDETYTGPTRHNFNAVISSQDMRDTFLPPFQACVQRGGANSIMCAFNAVNGLPSCASKPLLQGILRDQLGFEGFVVTDSTAINQMTWAYPDGLGFQSSRVDSTTKALKAGADMICKDSHTLHSDDVSSDELDRAVRRVLTARVRLGHFNPLSTLPWQHLTDEVVGAPEHAATAMKIGDEGTVLLKNEGDLLPLLPEFLQRVAVIGPFADTDAYLMGKGARTPGPITTPLEAIRAALPGALVVHDNTTAFNFTEANAQKDAANCELADVCVLLLGSRLSTRSNEWTELQPQLPANAYTRLVEGESHDRASLRLLGPQEQLWKYIADHTTKPLVVVLVHGGPLDISDMQSSPRVGAILSASYPGQHGSTSVARILFGAVSPSGRLPVTWYKESYTQQLEIGDMRMRASADYPGRTYRYWKGEAPLYRFGHGLSYVRFSLNNASIVGTGGGSSGSSITGSGIANNGSGRSSSSSAGGSSSATVEVTVENNGTWRGGQMAADTSVLLFMRYLGADGMLGPTLRTTIAGSGCTRGRKGTDLVQRLVGYQRTGDLAPGASKRLSFVLPLEDGSGSSWAGFGDPEPPCGSYALWFGLDQPEVVAVVLD